MQLTKLNDYVARAESINDLSQEYKDKLNRKKGSLENVEHELINNQDKLSFLDEKIKIIIKAQNLLNQISNDLRGSSLTVIEGIVTSAIREVFQNKPDVQFKLEMNTETSKPSLNAFVVENGFNYDPLTARGLGMADVISVALRICIKSMYKPRISFPLVLDEPFKFLHGENTDKSYPAQAFAFLKKVTAGLDEQVIFVTGVESKDFIQVANKVFQIEQEDGVSTIKGNE